MKLLVTLGPTRERIDDLRYITNPSSGKMGAALANEAAKRGWDVVAIAGPCDVKLKEGIVRVDVTSASEMLNEALNALDEKFDLFIGVAAVADFEPQTMFGGKIRSGRGITLRLKPTKKIIAEVKRAHPDLRIIAFKAEFGGELESMFSSAKRMLEIADMVVLNDVSGGVFGEDTSRAWLINGGVKDFGTCEKTELAKKILDLV